MTDSEELEPSGDVAELVERLQAGVDSPGIHDVGGSDDWDIAGADRLMTEAAATLTSIAAERDAAIAECNKLGHDFSTMQWAADAAEARVRELEGALDRPAMSYIYALLGCDTVSEAAAVWERNPVERKQAHNAIRALKSGPKRNEPAP